jgi:hypothetical protein
MDNSGSSSKAVVYAASACSTLFTTAFADAFRRDGEAGLRETMLAAMAGPCESGGGVAGLRMCRSDDHRVQMCADWFAKHGPCGDTLSPDYRERNRSMCEAAGAVARDYPELKQLRR